MIAKKLPIPVYAILYKGSNKKEIRYMADRYDLDVLDDIWGFWIRTPKGDLRLESGAWLAYGLEDKEVRVIQDEIFRETYTPSQTYEPIFIKKPGEVGCIRIDDFSLVTVQHVLEFINPGKINIDLYEMYQQAAEYRSAGVIPIPTLEGTMKAKVGDYLVRGPKGEVYPVSGEVFNKIYYVEDYVTEN